MRWSLAWDDDEDAGFSTFLQGNRFTTTEFGDPANPGVSRDGYDLGGARVVGYESNLTTIDAFAWTASTGDEGSPLAGP